MPQTLSAGDRLQLFRAEMARLGLAAVIVPTSDPHLSEYVPAHWKIREALSGFTGSAGTLLVTPDAAALLTDSRYWVQAEKQLIDGIELVRLTGRASAAATEWLAAHASPGGIVGVNAEFISLADGRLLESTLMLNGLRLRTESPDIAAFWPDRPAMPASPVAEMKRPGRSRAEKLAAVREELGREKADAALLNSLDDIAWLTGLRGADVPCNPVFLSTLLVGPDRAALFIDTRRVGAAVTERLAADGVMVLPPEKLAETVGLAIEHGRRILLDPEHTNAALAKLVPPASRVEAVSPVFTLKAVKSAGELEAIDEAMIRDAVALAEFYAELDERLSAGEKLTEADAARMLHASRAKDPEFFDESFTTIAAFGPNAALPHYTPPAEGGAVIEGDGLLLIDSGAQFTCGTTDITRMTPVGTPSAEMKHDVTLVTRGMLRLLGLRFPKGYTGSQIDAVARMDLWAEGRDYGHGTGHGVGYVLNVHEDPVRISPMATKTPLAAGNVVSDEPGLYRPGAWGVRVENLMVCEKAETTEFGEFLKFRALTMMPIDTRALEEPFGALADQLNRFNDERLERLLPLVSERCRRWLERAVKPVSRD
ncbi:M24B family metallopeptidase [Sutterella sp.]|uniref:M24B family metallopeptidase n=1 Tax=Sutterella sp. TaxID=1981025 RepID=UPI0026DF5632|nr:M24B family metallopeptidase [Sutterella sp.]MDO5530629.1 M24 family metallopeptidase [Sutterella sp.]